MIKAAIEKILSLAEPVPLNLGEDQKYEFLYHQGVLSEIREPKPAALEIHTLSGIVDWIETLDVAPAEYMIFVNGFKSVSVAGYLKKPWNRRHVFLESNLIPRQEFPFNHFIEIEQFIIKLQCSFVHSDTKQSIISNLASIKSEEVTKATDDGISQAVAVENKVGRLEKIKMDPMVNLAPYRTFDEAEQPVSKFLLRLRRQKDSLPLVGLFEADGGAWKYAAIKNVASYLRGLLKEKNLNVPIIA